MFNGNLFKTQKPAAAFLCNKRKALLAWEQGTGKTIISLAAAEKLFELGKVQQALVIAPGSFLWQWQDRIDEFTTSSSTLVTAKDKESRELFRHQTRYVLLPYSLFRRDYKSIPFQSFDLVICDEAQEFKNHTTKTHNLLKQWNREFNPTYRWALTGTTITNKLEDLYSILYWVDKTFLPAWPTFEERHIVRNSFGSISSYKNLKSLAVYLPHKVDRKTEKDMPGQLPKIRKQVHKIEQSEEYEAAQAVLLAELEQMVGELKFDGAGGVVGAGAPNAKVSRAFAAVRQAAASQHKLRYAANLIRRLRDENYENKFVVFSYFKEPLIRTSELLHAQGFNTYRFTGDEDSVEKRRNIQLFKSDPSGVLVCSNAGASGLDLPFANQLVNLDVPFAFGTLDQRIKRIVRASSKFQTVMVHYLIMEYSIEEFYFLIVRAKGALQSAIHHNEGEDEVIVRPMSLRQYLMGERLDADT